MKRFIILVLAVISLNCGSSESAALFSETVPTQVQPVITRINPGTVAIGSNLTIFGVGFSIAASENIVNIGGINTLATEYEVLASSPALEVESLTVPIPSTVPTGVQTIFVTVVETPSNTDLTVIVTP